MSRIVPPYGPSNANILLVGEAPGRQEEEYGVPFYEGRTHYGGPTAGALLTSWLHAVNIPRSECRLTNIILERPPDNDITYFVNIKSNEPYTKQALEYIKQLKQEIQSCDPNIIVAFGLIPAYVLTGESELGGPNGATKFRGSILPCTLVEGYKVLCTYHPASAMIGRSPLNKYWILADLQKVKKVYTYPGLLMDESEYILYPTFKETLDYLNACKAAEYFAFDAELSNREIPCESFSYSPDHAMCIPFMNEDGTEYFTLKQEAEIWKKVAEILESDTTTLAFNAGFDTFLHLYKYGIKPKNVQCCRLAMQIAYADLLLSGDEDKTTSSQAVEVSMGQKQKSLATFTSLLTTIPYYKDESKYKMKYGVGKRYLRYCALDSRTLMIGYPRLKRILQKGKNWSSFLRQQRLTEPFNYNGLRGIQIDTKNSYRIGDELDKELYKLETEIQQAVGYPINVSSPKQLAEYFYDICKVKNYVDRSTNKVRRMRLMRHKNPEVALVAEKVDVFKLKDQLLKNFFKVVLSDTGILHTMMDDAGTRFGRPSSSYNKVLRMGTNLQNLPAAFKRLMVPSKDYIIYKVDGKQAENRIVAYDNAMIRAFEDGRNIHAFVASMLFGGPPEKEYQDSHYTEYDPNHTQYAIGKSTGHGSNYLMSYKLIALLNNLSEAFTKKVQKKYFKEFPSIKRWQKSVETQLKKNMTITNLYGRKYRFYRPIKSILPNAIACNPQGTIGELTNQVYCDIYYDQNTFKPVELLLIEHDGLYFQVPISIGWPEHERILLAIKALMERPLYTHNREFCIPAEITMMPFNFDGKNAETCFEIEDVSAGILEITYENAMEAVNV